MIRPFILMLFLFFSVGCSTQLTQPTHKELLNCAGYTQVYFDHKRNVWLHRHSEAEAYYEKAEKLYSDLNHDFFDDGIDKAKKLSDQELEIIVKKCKEL